MTALVAAVLLAGAAAAAVGGGRDGAPGSAADRAAPEATCPTSPGPCSASPAVPARLSLEPRTGVCLS